MPAVPSSPWLDAHGAAAYLAVSEATLLRAARAGQLRGYKVSGRKIWRFRSDDLDAFLMRATTPVLVVPRQQERAAS